jgi:hypothetical protein
MAWRATSNAMNLPQRAHELLEQQKTEWDVLRDGYASLARVETRAFDFDGFQVQLHFNPGRLASSAAKVDAASIAQRPCFLCPQNRPDRQRALVLHDDLVLLCNPFPIFPEHFTIPTLSHRPQRIRPIFPLMLDLAREMSPRYTVFYNGPQSGASAPDHLHLQAGNAGFTPIDREYEAMRKTALVEGDDFRAFATDQYLRRFVSFEGSDRNAIIRAFERLHSTLEAGADEPMLNVFATYVSGAWRVIVFPREKHRPSAYFADGDAKLLLSPGAVDMAGAVIVPVRRDFERITKDDLARMYDEVTLNAEAFARLVDVVRA